MYTESDSRIGILARQLRFFLVWSGWLLSEHKARVKTKKVLYSQRSQNPTVESLSVYMKILAGLFIFLCSFSLHADISKYYKKCENKSDIHKMQNVDFIYLINLDKRPQSLLQCLSQLHPYGIYPYRFSAVNGYALTLDELKEIGVKLARNPKKKRKAIYFMVNEEGIIAPNVQNMRMNERTYFNVYQGCIGCSLSHLSILQDAYDSNYETIWILEDDFAVKEDPRVMSDLIEELDSLVGKENWDILFTDIDQRLGDGTYSPCRPSAFYRPNHPYVNLHVFDEQINDNFRRISARCGTHSMIVRKNGIKKILNYLTFLGLFVAYDREINNIENIQMYALTRDIITNNPSVSSDAETAWDLAEMD